MNALPSYYFACGCGELLPGSAWYLLNCPRCNTQLVSSEQLQIPWRTELEPSTSNGTNKGR